MTDLVIRRPEDDPHNFHLRVSAQRALLGAIGPSVRAVSVAYGDNTIVFQAFVDPGATEAEREDLDDVAGEVIADYPAGWRLEVAIDDTIGDPPGLPELVYQRRAGPGDIAGH